VFQPRAALSKTEFGPTDKPALCALQCRSLQPTEEALAPYAEVERSFVGIEKIARAADPPLVSAFIATFERCLAPKLMR